MRLRSDNVLKLLLVVLAVGLVGWFALKPPVKGIDWLPVTKYVRLGLDLKGGVHVVLQAVDTPEAKVTPEAMKRVIGILEERINRFGVTEPVIQQQGSRRVIVEIAGVKDPEEVVGTLIKTAYLEFKTEGGEVIVTGRDLKEARESLDPQSNQPEVDLTFNPVGAKKFAEATTENVGRKIAIYLDGKMIQEPTVQEPITNGRARITGYSTLEEAHRIAVLLQSGALPVKLEVLEKRTVGPTLGADSLDKSLKAGAIGLLAILLFMILYYRVPGLVANFSLVIYALLVLFIFIAFGVTMTLPGIAGYILSLAVAVDANIIIFERLKEELRSGKTLRTGIDDGFKRAFVAIFDANLTTVLAALVLYYFGTGPIKGFAVTLAIGVAVSMFTAITMTRWLLHLVAGTGLIKNPKAFGA
ncbi:MAG: protein translocase subunit SecD [Thermoanaerobacteraceae bacterium]|nr:protein translocase subunit SecD [Thermoanaerobacteraceae bacterium]